MADAVTSPTLIGGQTSTGTLSSAIPSSEGAFRASQGLATRKSLRESLSKLGKSGRKTDYVLQFYFSDSDKHSSYPNDKSSNEVSMADIARWNLTEGHPVNGKPKWSEIVNNFIDNLVDRQANQLISEIVDLATEGVGGKNAIGSTNIQTARGGYLSRSVFEAFLRFGWMMKSDIRDAIISVSAPPVEDSTKKWRKWKGVDEDALPLSVTGEFANSLKFSINGREYGGKIGV